MSASLHLNLLNDDERVCSSPVRMRVMLPVFAVLTVIGLCVWWSLLAVRLHNAVQVKHLQETRIDDLKPRQEQVLSLRAREREARAVLEQLRFYRASRICFSETLLRLPQHVPEAVQLTDLRIPPPPPLPPPAVFIARTCREDRAAGAHQSDGSGHLACGGPCRQQQTQRGGPRPARCVPPA